MQMKIALIKLLSGFALIVLLLAGTAATAAAEEQNEDYFAYSPKMALLKGSFFQPFLVTEWGVRKFVDQYRYIAERKLDHVIWQWTADSMNKVAYYPTKIDGWQGSDVDLVGDSLAAAKATGIKVWLGLNWTDAWWSHYANERSWLENEFAIGRAVTKELWDRYGTAYGDTIAGFYITMEVDNINYREPIKQDRMTKVYAESVDYIHNYTQKPVMVAPFFVDSRDCPDEHGMNPDEYAAMWAKILAKAPIDVIAMQDGVGVAHVSVPNVGVWFEKMQQMIAKVRPETELWSDLETLKPDFTTAPNDRIVGQISAEQPFVKKFTTFAILHYQVPR